MTRDNVPAQLVADFQRPFEIEAPALIPHAGRRAAFCFGRDVHREPMLALVHHRQADARAGYRSAQVDRRQVIAAADPGTQVAALLNGLDPRSEEHTSELQSLMR